MKKVFVFLFCFIFIGTAFANGESVPTSKSYVDNALTQKQNVIERATGAAQVLTNTGTSGEYGTKEIYNSSAAYAGQSDTLIDAGTMNAAVQNAIDSEFECVEYDGNNNCLLMNIRGEMLNKTKNLLNSSFMDKSTYNTVTVYGVSIDRAKVLPTENNKTYTLSADLTYNGAYYYYLYYIKPDGTSGYPSGCSYMWANQDSGASGETYKKCTFTTQDGAKYVVSFANLPSLQNLVALENYQMEEGSTATPYQPYGNVYIPSGNQ